MNIQSTIGNTIKENVLIGEYHKGKQMRLRACMTRKDGSSFWKFISTDETFYIHIGYYGVACINNSPQWQNLASKLTSERKNGQKVHVREAIHDEKTNALVARCILTNDEILDIPTCWLRAASNDRLMPNQILCFEITPDKPHPLGLPNLSQACDGTFDQDYENIIYYRANLFSHSTIKAVKGDVCYVFDAKGALTAGVIIDISDCENEILLSMLEGKQQRWVHSIGIIGNPQECCTVWHPYYEEFVPLTINSLFTDKTFESEILFRVIKSKYDYNCDEWRLWCRNESQMSVSGYWALASNLIPTFEYDWQQYVKGFVEEKECIPQLDGGCEGDNIGEELRKMLGMWNQNEEYIREYVDIIQEDGVDADGVQKHSRFDSSGLATKECDNK